LNNFSKILFGFKKVFCNFEYPIRFKGEAAPKSSWLFLCLSYCICLFFIKEWRCNYHKGLKTFALESGWIMASATPFFVVQKNPIRFKMKTFQTLTIDGKEITINGKFSLPNALTAYSFFQQFSGLRVVAEYEGDVNYQLNILQANNPNSLMLLQMLRHLYNAVEPTLTKMENVENPMYFLNDN
jgi:hypothetical protein